MSLEFLIVLLTGLYDREFLQNSPFYFVGTYSVIYAVLALLPKLLEWVASYQHNRNVSPRLRALLYVSTIAVICYQIYWLVYAIAWVGAKGPVIFLDDPNPDRPWRHHYPLNLLPRSIVEQVAAKGALSLPDGNVLRRSLYTAWTGPLSEKTLTPVAAIQFAVTLAYGLGITVSAVMDAWTSQPSSPYTNRSILVLTFICARVPSRHPLPSHYSYLLADFMLLVEMVIVLVNSLMDRRKFNFAVSLVLRTAFFVSLILEDAELAKRLSSFEIAKMAYCVLGILYSMREVVMLAQFILSSAIWALASLFVERDNIPTPFEKHYVDPTVLTDQVVQNNPSLFLRTDPLPLADDFAQQVEVEDEDQEDIVVEETSATNEDSSSDELQEGTASSADVPIALRATRARHRVQT